MKKIIIGLSLKKALDLVDQWNLQEYEGIDETEGHL